jgi:hypothetical protein
MPARAGSGHGTGSGTRLAGHRIASSRLTDALSGSWLEVKRWCLSMVDGLLTINPESRKLLVRRALAVDPAVDGVLD